MVTMLNAHTRHRYGEWRHTIIQNTLNNTLSMHGQKIFATFFLLLLLLLSYFLFLCVQKLFVAVIRNVPKKLIPGLVKYFYDELILIYLRIWCVRICLWISFTLTVHEKWSLPNIFQWQIAGWTRMRAKKIE